MALHVSVRKLSKNFKIRVPMGPKRSFPDQYFIQWEKQVVVGEYFNKLTELEN